MFALTSLAAFCAAAISVAVAARSLMWFYMAYQGSRTTRWMLLSLLSVVLGMALSMSLTWLVLHWSSEEPLTGWGDTLLISLPLVVTVLSLSLSYLLLPLMGMVCALGICLSFASAQKANPQE